jgi:hypothetical protein
MTTGPTITAPAPNSTRFQPRNLVEKPSPLPALIEQPWRKEQSSPIRVRVNHDPVLVADDHPTPEFNRVGHLDAVDVPDEQVAKLIVDAQERPSGGRTCRLTARSNKRDRVEARKVPAPVMGFVVFAQLLQEARTRNVLSQFLEPLLPSRGRAGLTAGDG